MKQTNMTQKQKDTQVAATILQQLGGRQFIAMTGAHSFVASPKGMSCKLRSNMSKAGVLRITLNGNDLYKMEFVTLRGKTTFGKVLFEYDDVYCDDLQDFFTQVTGMYTRF